MPPKMSDNERIPKRGRPSKKIAQNNLKFKRPDKSSIAEHVEKKEKVQIKDVPATISELVSTYTITDSGRMQKVDLKVKENKKNKVRAEAFQSLLDQIAQGTKSITTPVGVVSIPSPPKLLSLSPSSTPTSTIPTVSSQLPRRMNKEDVAVVEELAKQYKISNSIIDRHLDAVPSPKKNSVNLKNDEITKVVSSTAANSSIVTSLISSSVLTNSTSTKTFYKITDTSPTKVRGSITLHDKALHGSNIKLKMPSANPIKETEALANTFIFLNGLQDGQKSSDVQPSNPIESESPPKPSKTKKKSKKSKKKKKKEKKAKSKELKKELKRLKKEKKKAKKERKKNKERSESKKTEKKLKKQKSLSSLDPNSIDKALLVEATNEEAKVDSVVDMESNNENCSVKSVEHVFGSNILADNKVSTFGGLKTSDSTIENTNETSMKEIKNSTLNFSNVDPVERFGGDQSAFKKAKIRKKKILRRSKLDPQFLDEMDKLASVLNSTQIDSNSIQSMPPNDVLDYKFLKFSNTPKVNKVPSMYKNLSVFCYAQFFQTHGWIKPPLETTPPVQKSAIFTVNQEKSCFGFKDKTFKNNGTELSTFTKTDQETIKKHKKFSDRNETYSVCSNDGSDNRSKDLNDKNTASKVSDQKQSSNFFDLNLEQLKNVEENDGQTSTQPVDVDLLNHLKAAFDKNLVEGKITSDVLNTTFHEAVKQYKINNNKNPESSDTSKFLLRQSEPEVKPEETTNFSGQLSRETSVKNPNKRPVENIESKRASKASKSRKRSTCSNIISINNRGKKVLQVPPLNIHSFSKSLKKNLSSADLEIKKKSLEEVVRRINKSTSPNIPSKTLNKVSLLR